ncbi:MAG: hypothetical protein NUW21_12675, partial [Elusimicrobia bacterium]|nr:hypothetical protein [Elusimicrobiota bacterium]
MPAAVAAFLILFLARSRGVGAYLSSNPSAVDAESLRLWAVHAVLPLLAAAAAWAAGLGLGRGAAAGLRVRPQGFAGAATAAALGL